MFTVLAILSRHKSMPRNQQVDFWRETMKVRNAQHNDHGDAAAVGKAQLYTPHPPPLHRRIRTITTTTSNQ